jgi:hypothetical protein
MTKAKATTLMEALFAVNIPFSVVEKGANDWNVVVQRPASVAQVSNFATTHAVNCEVRLSVFS